MAAMGAMGDMDIFPMGKNGNDLNMAVGRWDGINLLKLEDELMNSA